MTSSILHNICKDLQVPDVDGDDEEPIDNDEIADETYADAGGYAIRDLIVNNYFT